MRVFFFLICLLLPLSIFSAELTLKEKLAEAHPGSYLVTEQNKIFTFLHVNEVREGSLVLEEVVIPAARFACCGMAWRDWFQNGAPGHTAWLLTQINLQTGNLEEMFSFPHQGWVETSKADSFMATLLNLHFKEVPDAQRRRIGLPPGYGKPDHRPLWNPRLVVEGIPFTNVPFSAWKARWPSDGSELSRKIIEVYLPEVVQSPHLPAYPAYFPFWMEVEGKIGSAKIRVVDSGTGVVSPKPRLPRRHPQFIGNGTQTEEGLSFKLNSPSYFHDFLIIAEEMESYLGKTFVLPCETHPQDDHLVVFIAKEEMEKFMSPGEHYRLSLSPKEDLSICIEAPLPVALR